MQYNVEIVKQEEAIRCENSHTCTVFEYPTKNPNINLAVAEIVGRYPESGYACNKECTEMGYVLKGSGFLITETKRESLSVGDVVCIPSGEKYYWEGKMTLLLPATPAWTPDQHLVGCP